MPAVKKPKPICSACGKKPIPGFTINRCSKCWQKYSGGQIPLSATCWSCGVTNNPSPLHTTCIPDTFICENCERDIQRTPPSTLLPKRVTRTERWAKKHPAQTFAKVTVSLPGLLQ